MVMLSGDKVYATGTDGEFDWMLIPGCSTLDDAISKYCDRWGIDKDELPTRHIVREVESLRGRRGPFTKKDFIEADIQVECSACGTYVGSFDAPPFEGDDVFCIDCYFK